MKFRLALLCGAAAFASLAAAGADAAVITSYDRASFQAALSGGMLNEQNFDSLANGTLLTAPINGVTFGASAGTPIVTNAYVTSTNPNGLGSTSVGYFLATETASFTFATPITAFAIDINTFAQTNGAYRGTLNIGDSVLSVDDPFLGTSTGQFLGFTSDTPFTSVTIAALTGFSYTLDTLVWGDASAVGVPEPGSLLLLASGLAGLAASRRRKS